MKYNDDQKSLPLETKFKKKFILTHNEIPIIKSCSANLHNKSSEKAITQRSIGSRVFTFKTKMLAFTKEVGETWSYQLFKLL